MLIWFGLIFSGVSFIWERLEKGSTALYCTVNESQQADRQTDNVHAQNLARSLPLSQVFIFLLISPLKKAPHYSISTQPFSVFLPNGTRQRCPSIDRTLYMRLAERLCQGRSTCYVLAKCEGKERKHVHLCVGVLADGVWTVRPLGTIVIKR